MTPGDVQRIIDRHYPDGTPLRSIYMRHCRSVADLALLINSRRALGLDPGEVEAAAMLHDIGVFLTNAPAIHCHGTEPYIRHGILGAELLRSEGVPPHIAAVAEHHTGAGITADEIRERHLPLPARDFMPVTLLEQLVCYADKFYSKTRLDTTKTLEAVRASMLRHSPDTLRRFDALHERFGLTSLSSQSAPPSSAL